MKTYRATKKEKQIWRMGISSIGSSEDLRRIFPVMIGASSKFLGENTRMKLDIELREDSEEVLAVRGLSAQKTRDGIE